MSLLHKIWRVSKPILEVVAAIVVVLALALITSLGHGGAAVKNSLQGTAVTPTSASTNGPLSGHQSSFDQETACMKKLVKDPANNMENYLPAIGAPEHTDNIKTGVYPCATWTGDFDGTNQVFQYASETTYSQINFVVFDGPNGAYLQGGGLGPPSPGQYVSKFDPSTGKEIWRTYLTNAATTQQWIAFGSMGITEDGSLIAVAGPKLWKLDRETGAILKSAEVPIDPKVQPATGANLDGFTLSPDPEGAILMKTQTRPNGCPTQGNGAMQSCQSKYGPQPDSTVVAVDPETLKTLDSLTLNQSVTARPITTEYKGIIYMYMNGAKTLTRVIWDPETHTLTQDKSWAPNVIQGKQTGGTAPGLLGRWVVWNTNANGSKTTPQCVGVVSQDDPTDIHRVCPWGKTMPAAAGFSETPALPGVDPDNSMFFVQDLFLGGVHAIKVDQKTGDLKVVWSRGDWVTSDYFSMVGPPGKRVLISQNMGPDFTVARIPTFSYSESVLWVDEATGKTISESAYNPSTALGSLINVGYGGRYYTMGNNGRLYIYQVEPCSKTSGTPAVPQSTTHCKSSSG